MMLLCPNHHDEATQQVMSPDAQRAHKADPYNIRHGFAAGQLHVEQAQPQIVVGKSVGMVGDGPLVVVDHEPLLAITVGADRTLLVSVALYDNNDRLLASIEENEWIAEEPLPWDLEFGYRTLALRSGKGKIDLEID